MRPRRWFEHAACGSRRRGGSCSRRCTTPTARSTAEEIAAPAAIGRRVGLPQPRDARGARPRAPRPPRPRPRLYALAGRARRVPAVRGLRRGRRPSSRSSSTACATRSRARSATRRASPTSRSSACAADARGQRDAVLSAGPGAALTPRGVAARRGRWPRRSSALHVLGFFVLLALVAPQDLKLGAAARSAVGSGSPPTRSACATRSTPTTSARSTTRRAS